MDYRRNLLWIDGLAALIAGILMLVLSGWLSWLYELPYGLLIFMGCINLAYSCYSLSLARRATRPIQLIWLLVAANSFWAIVCFVLAYHHGADASWFGLAHFIGEGIFVGALAFLEFRWRRMLLVR